MNGRVSVIMPSYNTGAYISESIESVLFQTYTNWELLIVDDCSSDNTDEVIRSYSGDDRIKFFKNDKRCGAAVCRNRALREASGKWIAFLDSDDRWYSTKLEKQISFMEANDLVFSYTMYREMNEDGTETGIVVFGPRKITNRGMRRYCWPGCLTVMYDKEKLGTLQITEIEKNNDYAMWLDLSKKAECYLLPEVLAAYRRKRSGSVSNQSKLVMLKWHYRLFRKCELESAPAALVSTARNALFGTAKKLIYVKRGQK